MLGLLWDDEHSHDDIVVSNTMYLIVGKPVKLIINSRDVIHDVGMAAFRMKMDAVPGMPTTIWFTPLFTTVEMKKKTGDPDFEYEISCDQICGRGHYSMRGEIQVVTEEEFILWRAKQQPNYTEVMKAKEPPSTPVAGKDSTVAPAAKLKLNTTSKLVAQTK